jgi:hypothetical protein
MTISNCELTQKKHFARRPQRSRRKSFPSLPSRPSRDQSSQVRFPSSPSIVREPRAPLPLRYSECGFGVRDQSVPFAAAPRPFRFAVAADVSSAPSKIILQNNEPIYIGCYDLGLAIAAFPVTAFAPFADSSLVFLDQVRLEFFVIRVHPVEILRHFIRGFHRRRNVGRPTHHFFDFFRELRRIRGFENHGWRTI